MFLFINKFLKTSVASGSARLSSARRVFIAGERQRGTGLHRAPLTSPPPKPQTIYRGTPRSPLGTSFHLALVVPSPTSTLPCGRAALSPLCSWDNPCMEKRRLGLRQTWGCWRGGDNPPGPTPSPCPTASPPCFAGETDFHPNPTQPKAPDIPRAGRSSPPRPAEKRITEGEMQWKHANERQGHVLTI